MMIKSQTRLYHIWYLMRRRCRSTKEGSKDFILYASRGIRVCPEWDNSFEAFEAWSLANGYASHLTIDRFPNNDGNYEPSNCRWATAKQQANNRRITKLFLDGLAERRPYADVPIICLDSGEIFPTLDSAALRIFGNVERAVNLRRAIRKGHKFGGHRWDTSTVEAWEKYRDSSSGKNPTKLGAVQERPFPDVPVVCIDTGEVFPTKAAAGRRYFGKGSAGCTLTRAIEKGHTFAGMQWAYYSKEAH